MVFGMNVEGGMIALVGKERRDTSRSIRSIVVSKFSERKKGRPVILLVCAVMT